MEANDAFTGDLLGMIAEILVQMMQKRSMGMKQDEQDKEFLRKILEEKDNKEGIAGTMAEAAAPKEKGKKGKRKSKRPERRKKWTYKLLMPCFMRMKLRNQQEK